MKNIFKSIKSVVFIALLILSSCVSHKSKIACPSFDSNKITKIKRIKKEINLPKVSEVFSFKSQQSKNKRLSKSFERDEQVLNFEEIHLNSVASAEGKNLSIIKSKPYFNAIEFHQNNAVEAASHFKIQKPETAIKPHNNLRNKEKNNTSVSYKKSVDDEIKGEKSERKTAIIKGGAIILMAILSGVALSVLGTLTASIGLVAIFLLDVLISVGIYRYYKKEKPKLAKVTSLLRLLYSAIFGIGIGYHIAGSIAMFNKFWSIGLIGFGLHLIALGLLFNNEDGKKWVNIAIKSLLITAGIGYIILNIGVLLVPNPAAFTALIEPIFIFPQILCEISFAIWMIFKGGKKSKNNKNDS